MSNYTVGHSGLVSEVDAAQNFIFCDFCQLSWQHSSNNSRNVRSLTSAKHVF